MHSIKIERINDVLCAKVGCQQFFYFTPEAIVADLAFYLKGDPGQIQEAYFDAKRKLADRGNELRDVPEVAAENHPNAPVAEEVTNTESGPG